MDGFRDHTRFNTTLYTLPARFWKWRMHGAAVTFARRLQAERPPADLLFASDMLDLAAFVGLTGELTAGLPRIVYFHENQLTYPPPPGEKRDLHYGFINYTSALIADRALFNSRFHRDSFLDELPRLLKHFPDYNELDTVAEIEAKSQVLPLGCDLAGYDKYAMARDPDVPVTILWNQRWEYDKNPAQFFAALYRLADEGLDFQVILAGQNFRMVPEEFEEARERLGERVIHYGYAEPEAYARLLWQADVVISTAIHEFFGVAVVEACYCGCYPILPRRLSYPELIPESAHERHLYDDFAGLLERLRYAITHRDELAAHSLRDHMRRFDWSHMIPHYEALIEEVSTESHRKTRKQPRRPPCPGAGPAHTRAAVASRDWP